MKVSLFNNYGARNSPPVFQAIQKGLEKLGHVCVYHDMHADVAVIWSVVWHGRMKHNQQVWNHFRTNNRPVIVAEVGMLDRGVTWKIGVNGTGIENYNLNDTVPNRDKKLNLELSPWRNKGKNIVIALQRHDSEQWSGMPTTTQWLADTVSKIKEHSDRHIIVRCHPRQPIKVPSCCFQIDPVKIQGTYDNFDYSNGIADAWAVINWNSGPGPQAVIQGVPAFVGHSSLASPVANLDLVNIEKPLRPDRTQWLNQLAHTEWTIEEIQSGEPLLRLEPF